MCTDRRHPPTTGRPTLRQPLARSGGVLVLTLVLALLLALPLGGVLAAQPQATLVQPSSSGQAKAARQALLKQRAVAVPLTHHHPGKTVGGTRTPPAKTIVTKRFLPK
jgi:hypothetical protein